MKYLLDTNICIYIINRKPKNVLHRLHRLQPESVTISTITVAELYYGCHKSEEVYRTRNLQGVNVFTELFESIPFDQTDAGQFGKLKALLQRKGAPLSDLDLLIAAQAITRKLVLVTNDTQHFRRIPGLQTENWVR
jgi:tRNA(fMet)-specific endonuclease VapC